MKSISTFLWFNNQAEEATKFYTGLFNGSSQTDTALSPFDIPPVKKGSVLMTSFELAGRPFAGLNGGPTPTFNPAISMFVSCETEKEIDDLFQSLSEGGVLMPLQKYPFSPKYCWVKDKFGLSWQLNLAPDKTKITPLLMFTGPVAGKAEEAMQFYTSIFAGSEITQTAKYGPENEADAGSVVHGVFTLDGEQFMAMDSHREHAFNFNESVSFMVNCDTQEEVDYYWNKLTPGGKEVACGWLKDRYGVFWQITPVILPRLLTGSDRERAERVMKAMMKMVKLDIAALEQA